MSAKKEKEHHADPLFPPGLINSANTCFFNSVMQCFIASTLLQATVESLTPSLPLSVVPARSPALVDAHEGPSAEKAAMPISISYIDFLERSWNAREVRDRRSLSPRAVLTQLGAKYDQYLDFRQQDAHELYCHLLDAMHMEEYDIIKKRQPPPPKPNKKARRDARRMPMIRGESSGSIPTVPAVIPEEEKLRPFVDQVFGGTLTSMVVCETCRHVSHTYEDYTDLSLSIRSDEKHRKRDRLKNISQLFRIPARSARPLSLPPSDLSGLEDNADGRGAESDVEHAPPPASRPTMNGGALLGGSAPETNNINNITKRLSIRWGQGRPKRKEKDANGHSKSAAQSEAERQTGDERESDAEWEQVRKAIDSNHSGLLRPPASGHTTDAEEEKGAFQSFPKRPNALRLHSRMKGSSATIIPFRPPQKDEAAYIARILADTAPNVPIPAGATAHSQTSWLKLGGTGHGLVDCLRQFTSVEVLEGENAFACRRCWKIANAPGAKRKSEDRDDDDDDDDEDAEDEMAVENDNDLIVVSRPSTPSSSPGEPLTAVPPPMGRADSGELSMLSVPSRPPSVISQSAISIADSGDDLAASVISSPSTFPASHTRLVVERARSTSPTSGLPGGYGIPTLMTSSADDSPSTPSTVSDPSTPTPRTFASKNPFLFPAVPHTGRRPHQPSPLSDFDSGVASDSDYIDSELDPSAPPSEAGSRPASRPSTPPLPSSLARQPSKPRVPRSQQVIHRRALKRYLISSVPPILVIHLKRFEQLSKTATPFFGNLKKIEDFISFPESLDMGPFMAPRREDYGLKSGRGRPPAPPRREDEPLMYRLYGVVVHIGSMLGGHYIAYTALQAPESTSSGAAPDMKEKEKEAPKKSDRQWCYISDTSVRLVSFDEVLKAKAYLCFYERVYD